MLLAGCVTQPAPAPSTAPASTWVLDVESEGAYWLGPDWFRVRNIAWPLEGRPLALTSGQKPVPYLLLDGPEGPGLLFYGTVTATRYSPWTAYRLEVGHQAGLVMPAGATTRPTAPSPSPQTTAWTTYWQEQDQEYRPQIAAPVPWFWQPLTSGQRLTHTVELADAVTGPLTVTLRLWNQSTAAGSAALPRIWWDGSAIGTWRADGPPEQSWPTTLTQGAGNNRHSLVIEMPAEPDGSAQRLWLDGFGLTYLRALDPAPEGTSWHAKGDYVRLAGAEGRRLLDITDPATPLDLGMVDGGQARTEPGHRYWLGTPWLAPEPAQARPHTVVDRAALAQAAYVVVAPEPFWDALQPLVEYHRGRGLAVARLSPSQVYDAFGDGRPDPEAIRSMVNELFTAGALRYLLLAGDASARPDGYAGQEGNDRIVTALVPIAHLRETPSDQALIVDPEGRPLAAVGRLPAETPDQVAAMVHKILRWEQQGAAGTLLLSDDQDDFRVFANDMLAYLPASSLRLDAGEEGLRPRLLSDLDRQPLWLNYVGHGSLMLWGDEKVFQREDRWAEPAVVTVWACLSAYFIHPEQDSMAEAWLRAEKGGAVSFLGPTGETYLTQQHPLARVFYREVQAGQAIGDALLTAWQEAGPEQEDAVRSFLLLGDPALRLFP